jgi:hypothetical protein
MGDYKVIAGVSNTLRTLLRDRMESAGQQNGPGVTLLPPDESPSDGREERVNLFLYRVGEHEQLKNQRPPGDRARSSGVPLSLTLHYLLTAHSNKKPPKAQWWLADAMRVFHDYSIITEDLAQKRASSSSNGQPSILAPQLDSEHEQIKISLDPLSVDQMTEIWTVFTVPYRLSAAYSVSVVQIESQQPEGVVRLVGQPTAAGPRVHSVPFQTPRIQEIRVERRDDSPPKKEWRYPYARIGDTLIIRGHNLTGEGETRVRIGEEEEVVVSGDHQQDTRLEVPLPDENWLKPGTYPVSVRRTVAERTSSDDAFSYTSNQCFFALVPRINVLDPATLTPPDTLSIEGERLSRNIDETVVFIGRTKFEESDFTTQSSTEIKMEISSLSKGDYPVRVRVAGMESILDDAILTIED